MSYINRNFLLENQAARKLYSDYAKEMPIFDYHCHLPERQIFENKPFNDLYEIWLAGDHYKWRLMRNYGINERYITGNASNKEKFEAYCTALQSAFGNPLYHWSQVELEVFFCCTLEINGKNANAIWEECNRYIIQNEITPQKLIEQSGVKYIFTTNEIFDDLSVFDGIAEKGYKFKVIPAFRADKIMNCDYADYAAQLKKLESLCGPIGDLDRLERAVEERLQKFIQAGTVAGDIALEYLAPLPDRDRAAEIFGLVLQGKAKNCDTNAFKAYFTKFLMGLFAKYGIVAELHVGAMRNNNSKMYEALGADTGYDSVSDANSTAALARLFDSLNSENLLPKTILFNLNPKMNVELTTLLGCFQDDSARGKIQYGPAWWFLDNKAGMEKHLKDLTATGHIATFIGMLTDSRSFLSYPRHHYFRRILCNYLGGLIEKSEITDDIDFVGGIVKDICYTNAVKYFGVK